jgi:hypothetical protein
MGLGQELRSQRLAVQQQGAATILTCTRLSSTPIAAATCPTIFVDRFVSGLHSESTVTARVAGKQASIREAAFRRAWMPS